MVIKPAAAPAFLYAARPQSGAIVAPRNLARVLTVNIMTVLVNLFGLKGSYDDVS